MPKKTKKAKLKAQATHSHSISPPLGITSRPSNQTASNQLEYHFAGSVNAPNAATTHLINSHFPAIKRDLTITLLLSMLAIGTELIIAWKIR